MTLKERVYKFYKSQRKLANVLRVRSYQQVNEALQEKTTQTGLRGKIEKHISKLEASEKRTITNQKGK